MADAYDDAGRAMVTQAGATTGAKLYRDSVAHVAPDAEIDTFAFDRSGKSVSIEDYDGIVWTGSNMTIHQSNDLMRDQVEFAREAFTKGVPQHGSCRAAQLAVVAAGGDCGPNPKGREFGISRNITLTEAGKIHPMMVGRPMVFDALTTHSDMVTTLPEGAVLLAENDFTRVQALAINHRKGTFWAVQYHPEFDLHEMARLVDLRRDMLIKQGSFADEKAADSYVEDLEQLHRTPERTDLLDSLGISPAVMSRDERLTELRNWLDAEVRPKAG
ncbi:MAG: type 1 glutamine amidotransferase [Proteobacteria bacterium]|nr:type 1 glutamine amidotransferase [Pseudomonadota bacterium]